MGESIDQRGAADDGEDRFTELVLRYFDGELDERELSELNGILRNDPAGRGRFVEHCTRSCLIRETFDPHSDLEPDKRDGPGTAGRGNRVVRMLATTVVVLMFAVGVLLFQMYRADAPIGSLQEVSGDVRIIGRDGRSRAIAANVSIDPGDTIRTRGGQSAAIVVYPDGTRMTLVGDTSITCVGSTSKSVVVHQGRLAASVRPQPQGKAMTLATPAAQVQVLGTQFLLDALEGRTNVSVTEGTVRLTRVSDGQTVDVANGKHAIVAGGREMLVRDIPALSQSWEADFEEGVPQGWEGEYVTGGLPRGSRGALRVVADENNELSIKSNDAWSEGLFAAGKGSHFHMTFKIEYPAWINVFVGARTAGPRDLQFAGNFLCNEFAKAGQSRWQTVSIPFANFKRLHRSERLEKLVPFRVVITTGVSDRSLVIDRIWVTQDGPGKIVSQVIE